MGFLSKVNALRACDEKTWPTMQSLISGLRQYLNAVKTSPEALKEAEEQLKKALGIEDQLFEPMEQTMDEVDVIDIAINALVTAYQKALEDLHELHEKEFACRDAI